MQSQYWPPFMYQQLLQAQSQLFSLTRQELLRLPQLLLMVLNLLLTAILAYQIFKTPPKKPEPMNRVTWLSMVLMVLFYGLTVSTDMFIAIAVVMFLLSLAWGERRLLIAAANAVLTPFLIFLLFDNVLRIRFPRGILMNWYYG